MLGKIAGIIKSSGNVRQGEWFSVMGMNVFQHLFETQGICTHGLTGEVDLVFEAEKEFQNDMRELLPHGKFIAKQI